MTIRLLGFRLFLNVIIGYGYEYRQPCHIYLLRARQRENILGWFCGGKYQNV